MSSRKLPVLLRLWKLCNDSEREGDGKEHIPLGWE